jgi:hypothetical protein
MLPSHFNSAARLMNANASRCNQAISLFHGVDNQRILNFPATCGQLAQLAGKFVRLVSEPLMKESAS